MAATPNEKSPLLEKNNQVVPTTEPTLCWAKLTALWSSISVEPLLFFHFLAYSIESIFLTNMMIDKTCNLQLNYSKEVCSNLDNGGHTAEQDRVQKLTANYQMYGSWFEYGLGIIVLIFLGAWGDTKGRVLPLFLPSVGSTLKYVVILLNAYFWQWEPYLLVLSYIPYGLGGSGMGLFMAMYAYLGDHSKERSRMTRLSLAGIMMELASPAGNALGTIIFPKAGYVGVFWAAFGFSLLSNVCIVFCIKVKNRKSTKSKKLTLNAVKESLMTVMQPRPGKLRAYVFGYIIIIWMTMISYVSLTFLFMYTRKAFAWTYMQYNIYSIVRMPISMIASCVILPILSYYLRLEDSLLGFVGSVSHIFYGIMVGTAPYDWILYLALVVSSLGAFVFIAARSALSKIVEKNELGGIFSIIALGEAVIPILMQPAFTYIYSNTLEKFPGAIFLIGSVIGVIACCIFAWILASPEKKAIESQGV
ncbi:proton-coupled folate transporter-like [Palaemon carinicauda]|uniref:proton-coupled folate transporter-like n=1 Tax=Palaemon carinicauda TaxID=392227 RepID=UPI0035B62DE4